MRLGRLELDRRTLRSRVARRIFAVFVACSLLPVVVFGAFAYREVRVQLEREANGYLLRDSRAAGMAIAERLLIAEERLRALATEARPEPVSEASRGRAGLRVVALLPPGDAEAQLSGAQRAHLVGGGALVTSEPDAAGTARIRMWVAPQPGTPRGALLVAELDPKFLFAPERRAEEDRYWVASEPGGLLFSDPPEGPLPPSAPESRGAREAFVFGTAGAQQLGASWPLFLRGRYLTPIWSVSVSRPAAEIYRPLAEFERVFPLLALATLALALVASLSQIRRSLGPIDALADGARRLSRGELDARVQIETRDEFGELGHAFNEMAHEISQQIAVLSEVNEIGIALSAEVDTKRLLDLILRGATRVTRAHGGAIYLAEEDRLHCSLLRLVGDEAGAAVGADDALLAALARRCFQARAPLQARLDSSLPGIRPAAAPGAWPLGECLGVPMRNGRDEVLGVLLLFREVGSPLPPFGGASAHLAESLASQAAIAITKNRLVTEFRDLFEGVIQLTARAIDEKSPYTGDHCRKVPILTELIADSACAAKHGPLKDFELSVDERYELRVAALLHDCGKVVTPVHVMDKATKLETIFDRIELVDTRFEILRRDRMLSTSGDARELASRLAELEAERAFLHRCNVGGEAMPEADRQRVHEIAGSHRFTAADGTIRPLLTPEEVENLLIERGTLNEAEREVIQQHVVTTINLLSELPFPRALRNVPAIAGSHHERVDGCGYPNGLRRDAISVQGRILGLADVFEALTAKDRPYKPGRTLSETLQMLEALKDEGHIDPDLYDLFVAEKVYLRYALAHLSPEQIDAAHWEDLERLTATAG